MEFGNQNPLIISFMNMNIILSEAAKFNFSVCVHFHPLKTASLT